MPSFSIKVCRKVASGKFSVFIYVDFYCILLVA